MAFLYNPDRMTEQEVRDTFVARTSLVDTLLQLIERQPAGAGVQHAIITGPRGMGKTTVLLMVQFRIAELELSKNWQPVKFPEESYSINDLADLWLEALHLLAASTNNTELESEIVLLQGKQLSVNDLQEHAWAMIKDWYASHKKRLVLLIDNFDMIIEQIGEDEEKSRLRDILMNDGTVMFIGTAVSFFKESNYDKPFYHFFRLFDLRGLTHEDVVILLKRRAEIDGIENFDTILAESRGRFLALEYFTGGNPRLVLMLYRVVTEWGSTEVRKALEKLLDEVTPYYKSRTEILPAQQRKILDHIARESAKSFEGLSPSDIATATRMQRNQVSMQLKRLSEAGYVRSANIKGRSSCFTLSEPLYAIWYQMRFSRSAKERMLWLVSFLKIWFELPQLLEEAKAVMGRVGGLCKANERQKALCVLEHGKYLLEAIPDGPEKLSVACEYLKSQMIAEDWENIRETTKNADLMELSDEDLIVLHQKKGIEELMFIVEIMRRTFSPNQKFESDIIIKEITSWLPEETDLCFLRGVVLYQLRQFEDAVASFDTFIQKRPDNPEVWMCRGITLQELKQFDAAIESYDVSLKLKPDMIAALVMKGVALDETMKFESAIEFYEKALQVQPNEPEAWYNRGNTLLKMKKFEEALTSFSKVLQIEPKMYSAWYAQGKVLHKLGRFKEAIESYDKALQIEPEDEDAWYCRGISLCEIEEYEAAIAAFDMALKINESNYAALNFKGTAQLLSGDYLAAYNSYSQYLTNKNDAGSWEQRTGAALLVASEALYENNPTKALHYLEEARKSEPIIGLERWMSLVLHTILINIPILPNIRGFITHANLDQQLFPLIRAIDYLETGNEELIEKLSPEYRKIVTDVAMTLKENQNK